MNKNHQDIDWMTRNLLKKSIQKPESTDFDDQLMGKILRAPSPVKAKSNGNITKKAWFFLIVAVFCFMTSTLILGILSEGYFNNISTLFSVTINWVFYGGMILFIPLVLYYFDALLQTVFVNRINKLSVG